MNKTYYLHSLGCKVNAYETTTVGIALGKEGYRPEPDFQKAGVIVLNTCSVTSTADQKSRQHLSRFRRLNPTAVIVAMGCYTQAHAEEAAKLGADIVLGAAERAKIPSFIEEFLTRKTPILAIDKAIRQSAYEELGATAFCDNARAYLKIQDGCDNFCSYCYIPFLRGNSRSRDPREVVKEAQLLVSQGYKEIVITGIHIGGYGKDLGDGSYRLADLLESLLAKCPSLPRLRISSIEESEIDGKFLALLARRPQIVDHIHIPLQSGSSSVLQRMKRHYDTAAFLAKLGAIRAVRPDMAITTDVIAGFPGESEAEWAETLAFCREARFAEIHVFPFSSRPGTAAARMKDTPPEDKKARVKELLALSKEMRGEYEARFYGRKLSVLFEEFDAEKGLAYGHTANYLLVAVPSGKPLHGTLQEITYESSIACD